MRSRVTASWVGTVIWLGIVACWATTAASLTTDVPKGELRGPLLTASLFLFIFRRTQPGPTARRIGQLHYTQGLRDGLNKAAERDGDPTGPHRLGRVS